MITTTDKKSNKAMYKSALTFRVSRDLRKAFATAVGTTGLNESNVARLLMEGFISGSISIMAAGTVESPDIKSGKRRRK